VFSTLKLKRAKKIEWELPNGYFLPGPTKIQKILQLELEGTKVMRTKNKNKV
jgi:hypothetical protein